MKSLPPFLLKEQRGVWDMPSVEESMLVQELVFVLTKSILMEYDSPMN